MLYAITGTMTPSKLSPAYRLGLFFTAMAMLVLPLIYIGLIVAVGYGVWWHLSSHALAFIESGYSKLVPQQFELTEATAADAERTLARAVSQPEELEPAGGGHGATSHNRSPGSGRGSARSGSGTGSLVIRSPVNRRAIAAT